MAEADRLGGHEVAAGAEDPQGAEPPVGVGPREDRPVPLGERRPEGIGDDPDAVVT